MESKLASKSRDLLGDILLLFDRPTEPIFTPKGDNETILDIPDEYLLAGDKDIVSSLLNIFDKVNPEATHLDIANVMKPDLSFPRQLGPMSAFSLFIPHHKKMAAKLIDIFMAARDADELMSWAVYARPRINAAMYNYALSVALLHRHDTKSIKLPNFIETFPDKYVDSRTLVRARAEVSVGEKGTWEPIKVPRDNTGSDTNIEHRVAYFREDLGVNLHHWHWHLVYPNYVSDRTIVAKDRRGELFYYMHHQVLARYNFERLSVNLNRVKRLSNLREPIPEGYFSKLDSHIAGRAWPARADNTILQDVIREVDNIRLDVSDVERWRDRILEAIEQGVVVKTDGTRVVLGEHDGIDILGDIVESSTLTANRALYGDLHNMGHVLLAFSHDPQHLHLESFGVMGDFATAMRDPVFYRWHAYLDDIFQRFKGSLPRYSIKRLEFPGIKMKSLSVKLNNAAQYKGEDANMLQTFWQESDINLSRGMDFTPRGSVFARFTHLQHEPFTYVFEVNNETKQQKKGTARIFMGPKYNERGQPFLMRDLSQLMVEMDKFVVTLNPGKNVLNRMSSESSVTIPFETTYRNLDEGRGEAGSEKEAQFNFCGCGWPHNMLIPKGKPEGMPMYVFIMISDHIDDKIDQDEEGECADATSYCGLRDRRYPDTKSMGYPFDRAPRDGVNYIDKFLTSNMTICETKIKFTERTVPAKAPSAPANRRTTMKLVRSLDQSDISISHNMSIEMHTPSNFRIDNKPIGPSC